MESPGLILANAPPNLISNGADNLLPLFDEEVTTNIEQWCASRVDAYWPEIRDAMHEELSLIHI